MKKSIKKSLGNRIENIIGCLGLFLGISWGSIMVSAALDHNPQSEYTNEPWLLLPIFYSWLILLSTPFLMPKFLKWLHRKFFNTQNFFFKTIIVSCILLSLFSLFCCFDAVITFAAPDLGFPHYGTIRELISRISTTVCAVLYPLVAGYFLKELFTSKA